MHRQQGARFAPIALLVAGCLSIASPASAALILGGLDYGRAQGHSIGYSGSGSVTTLIQGSIEAAFPNTTITTTPALTADFLNGINVVWLGSAAGDNSSTGLSSDEQMALSNFVRAGGGAVIFTDNNSFTATANQDNNSFLSPFGLDTNGTFSGIVQAYVSDNTSPVTNGPFGLIHSFNTNYPGRFDNLGASTPLAALGNNSAYPALAVLPAALGPGSGTVVFFSDSIFENGLNPPGNDGTNLILNAIALVEPPSPVPEPASLTLLALALAATGFLWRGRRAC